MAALLRPQCDVGKRFPTIAWHSGHVSSLSFSSSSYTHSEGPQASGEMNPGDAQDPGEGETQGLGKVWKDYGESLCSVMLVAQSCPTLCNTMDCSLPGSSAPGILQTGILEWVAIPFSGNLLTQGLNLGLLHCRKILYCLSHQGSQGVLGHIGKIHLERLTFHRKVRESYFQSAFHVCMLK